MADSYKVAGLKQEIINDVKSFMDRLLALCESEIEKQFLLYFIKYIYRDIYTDPLLAGQVNSLKFEDWKIVSIELIYDYIDWIGLQDSEIQKLKEKGYRDYSSDLIKTIGIQFKDERNWNESYTIYKLIPQFEVQLDKNYRFDFALVASHFDKKKLLKESKVAIECDGFEYHSSKEQLTRDNQRNRAIQMHDCKVYRMSGSEIYNVDTIERIQEIINDIRRFTK